MSVLDDLGYEVRIPDEVHRIVSIVPSLTESVATTGKLVGATDWCAHPEGLTVTRVRGTKNPELETIRRLRPDVVLANFEENREPDLAALRAMGLAVWVTRIRTVAEAFTSLRRLFEQACRTAEPAWLGQAEQLWAGVRPSGRRSAIIPIWRRPWMVVGSGTFAGDVLRRLGVDNLFAEHPERYPAIPLTQLISKNPDLVVLPDEPYAFHRDDGPESFPALPTALVSGRHLTWYGPSLLEAPQALGRTLHPRPGMES